MKLLKQELRDCDTGKHSTAIVRVRLCACSFLLWCMTVHAGSFQNLDFESSPWFPPGDYSYPFTIYPNALPGWTVHRGNTIQDGAWANEFILDSPGVALLNGQLPGPIDGGWNSVYLQSSATAYFDPGSIVNVSISQVGEVPMDATLLIFDAHNQWYDSFPIPPGPFEVSLGGTILSLAAIPLPIAGYVQYQADISPWAGQTTELSIKVLATGAWGNPNFYEGWAMVDGILIPSSVPEPSVIALIGLSGLFLGSFRCRKTVKNLGMK